MYLRDMYGGPESWGKSVRDMERQQVADTAAQLRARQREEVIMRAVDVKKASVADLTRALRTVWR